MKNIQAWGFLVSRNQYLDYRTIVAPSFMCEASASSVLAKAAEGDLTEQGFAIYREIYNSKVGNLTLVFRVIEASAEDTGITGNGVLKDSFGREIYLIEGIVLKERMPNIVVNQENFEETHKHLLAYYREFWDYSTPNPTIPSEPFNLQPNNSVGNCLKYKKLKEYIVADQQKLQTEQLSLEQSQKLWRHVSTDRFGGEISSVAFFPEGNLIAIRHDQIITVWNLSSRQKVQEFSGERIWAAGYATPIAINTTGQFIASAMIQNFDQNVVKLWDVKTKKAKDIGEHQFNGFHRVKAVAFTPNSKIVATGGGDQLIKLWDVKEEGLERGTLEGHSSEIKCIVISPNGETLASGDGHGVIKIWNLRTKEEYRTISEYQKPVNSLAFSPDGQRLASGSDECDITLWNIKTGKKDMTMEKHSEPVNSVTFSPDGKIIASGSDDCKIKIWDLKSQQTIYNLSEHTKAVTSVAFSPDGQTLVSGGKDCTIRVWQR